MREQSIHIMIGTYNYLAVSVPPTVISKIEKLICGLAVWLYVKAGTSRSVVNTVLRAMSYITLAILSLLSAVLAAHNITLNVPAANFPRDVRTAYSRHFSEPELQRRVCCPKCFHTFDCPVNEIPMYCEWRPSPKAWPCGASLWKTVRAKGGTMEPRCHITTQSFKSWLESFLSRKVIDDALQDAHSKQANNTVPPSVMRDVQDSPGYRMVFGQQRGPHDLAFGIYMDGFQIFKLKIAGKKHCL